MGVLYPTAGWGIQPASDLVKVVNEDHSEGAG